MMVEEPDKNCPATSHDFFAFNPEVKLIGFARKPGDVDDLLHDLGIVIKIKAKRARSLYALFAVSPWDDARAEIVPIFGKGVAVRLYFERLVKHGDRPTGQLTRLRIVCAARQDRQGESGQQQGSQS